MIGGGPEAAGRALALRWGIMNRLLAPSGLKVVAVDQSGVVLRQRLGRAAFPFEEHAVLMELHFAGTVIEDEQRCVDGVRFLVKGPEGRSWRPPFFNPAG